MSIEPGPAVEALFLVAIFVPIVGVLLAVVYGIFRAVIEKSKHG